MLVTQDAFNKAQYATMQSLYGYTHYTKYHTQAAYYATLAAFRELEKAGIVSLDDSGYDEGIIDNG